MKPTQYRITFEAQSGPGSESLSRIDSEIGMPGAAPPLFLVDQSTPPEEIDQRSYANPTYAGTLSAEQISQLIDAKIATLKVYVLESEITQAQTHVKSIVEMASF